MMGKRPFFMPEKATLNFAEALDNLAILPSFDEKDPYRLGILHNRKLVEQQKEITYPNVIWLTSHDVQDFLKLGKKCFKIIHTHLMDLEEKGEIDWEHPHATEGLKSLITMLGEAASKMDKLIKVLEPKMGAHSLTNSEEYQEFLTFYKEELASKNPSIMKGNTAWEKEWLESRSFLLYEMSQKGLKDFDTIKQDQEYELFYLKDEEGKPFFSSHLVRNIKLIWDFEEEERPIEEDPLLILPDLFDKERLSVGAQILQKVNPLIKEFYQLKIRRKSSPLIQALNRAVMALMLASDSKHLLENQSRKRAAQYFEDFRLFMKEAFQTDEYLKFIAYPPDEEDKLSILLLTLLHSLAEAFFDHEFGVKKEMLGLIHRLFRLGRERQNEKVAKSSDLEGLFYNNEAATKLLSSFPSGPLLKIMDVIRGDDQEHDNYFAPLWQNNIPFYQFSYPGKTKEIRVLRVPSPTYQETITKVTLLREFEGFLRNYVKKKKHHLLVNLQDRTSWKESARSTFLEKIQHQAEFFSHITVITLSKDSDFYHQKQEYRDVDQADLFFKSFLEQLKKPEDYGFYFPKKILRPDFYQFLEELFEKIHKEYFQKAKKLDREQRQNFIEIVYQSLIDKISEDQKVDSVSFTCKDALDVGSCQTFLFYRFLRTKSSLDIEEEAHLLWLFAPCLMVRERLVNPQRLGRVISAAAQLE